MMPERRIRACAESARYHTRQRKIQLGAGCVYR